MKNIFLLLSFFSFINLSRASDSTRVKIMFFRPMALVGLSARTSVSINDTGVFYMVNNSFYNYEGPATQYKIKDKKTKRDKLTFATEPDSTYYVLVLPVQESFSGYFNFIRVDSATFRSNMRRYANSKNMHKPLIRPLHRLGISVDIGPGFDNIFVGKATSKSGDETDITFSYGGGFGVGVDYGVEHSKYFDMMFNFGWVSSSLSPSIENGSMAFSRLNFGATGSLIIPIQGGYMKRFKLGAGPDYYLNNTLKMKMSDVPQGHDDTWEYNDAVGFHTTLIYEVNFSESFSADYGVRYNYVNYSFKSSSKGLYPIDDRVKNPNGQGMFFFIGLNFHF